MHLWNNFFVTQSSSAPCTYHRRHVFFQNNLAICILLLLFPHRNLACGQPYLFGLQELAAVPLPLSFVQLHHVELDWHWHYHSCFSFFLVVSLKIPVLIVEDQYILTLGKPSTPIAIWRPTRTSISEAEACLYPLTPFCSAYILVIMLISSNISLLVAHGGQW